MNVRRHSNTYLLNRKGTENVIDGLKCLSAIVEILSQRWREAVGEVGLACVEPEPGHEDGESVADLTGDAHLFSFTLVYIYCANVR